MSSSPIYVSRAGLTTCPACLNHFQVSASLGESTCPFCHASFAVALAQPTRVDRMLRGKSGMMLAALGVSISLAGCGKKNQQDAADAVSEQPVVSEQSAPASQPATDMGSEDQGESTDMFMGRPVEPAIDEPAMAEYGMPMVEEVAPLPRE